MSSNRSPEASDMESRTRAAVEAYVHAWASNDRAALLEVFAEDAVWIDPVGTPPYIGRDAIGKFWDQAHAGGSTLTPEVHRVVVCANEAVLLFRMLVRGPAGSGMALEVCDHMEVGDDGRIRVAKAFWHQSCVSPLAA